MRDAFDGENHLADVVIVPDVVGLPFLRARELASDAGLCLANPDPDGPPIGAIVWPNNPTIQRQHPEPGCRIARWESLRVWLRSDLEPHTAGKPDVSPPSLGMAHAVDEQHPPNTI
jgi:hypothetical protein